MNRVTKTSSRRYVTLLLFFALMFLVAPFSSYAALIKIGDEYEAGRVVYLLQPGDLRYVANEQHGLIAALEDLPQESFDWSEAMAATARLEINGYKGWSLPTRKELALLYKNQAIIGGFRDYSYYWSSSEISANKALALDFYNGESVVSNKSGALSGIRRIRPVRTF